MMARLYVTLPLILVAGCASPSDGEDGFRFAGDWCTPGTLGNNNLPLTAPPHIGGVFFQEGERVVGSGAVKRAGDNTLWPSRYAGDIVGERLLLEVTPLQENPEAPRFAVDLDRRTANELVGPATGDPGFNGTITLVRLGPRCFS
jgi:hypothetical protein